MVNGIQYIICRGQYACPPFRGPKDHTIGKATAQAEGSYLLALTRRARGIPETIVCRILMVMWSSGPPGRLDLLQEMPRKPDDIFTASPHTSCVQVI